VFLGFAVLLLIGGGVIAWVTYTLFRA
jgi:hypothetical protein